MATSTKMLPASTRLHLFNLVTNPTYRQNADSAAYDRAPDKDGTMGRAKAAGESVRKYGYDVTLAAGTATRGNGPDPGRYRLLAYTDKKGRTTWWRAVHLPANTYKFEKINIPSCNTCGGTADNICTRCKGSGRQEESVDVFAGPCTQCNKQGFASCATCAPPVVVDGVAISRTYSKWG